MKELDPEQAAALIAEEAANPDFQIIDVRTLYEFANGRLPGAVRVTWDQDFAKNLEALDKHAPCLVYCQSGMRSHQAVEYMEKAGFSRLFELAGGIAAWKGKGLPVT